MFYGPIVWFDSLALFLMSQLNLRHYSMQIGLAYGEDDCDDIAFGIRRLCISMTVIDCELRAGVP